MSTPTAFSQNTRLATKRRHNTRQIVDLALHFLDDDAHFDKVACFDLPLPPLDQVTVTTASDDSASISSMSTVDEDSTSSTASPRCIFKTYWDKKGGAASSLHRVPLTKSLALSPESRATSSGNTYERVLKVKEENKSPSPNSRRRIFAQGAYSKSEPSLDLVALAPPCVRKTESASALERKGSCLRKGRFSGRYYSRRESDSSVSFNDDVRVVVFERPVERWAEEGWSQWFA